MTSPSAMPSSRDEPASASSCRPRNNFRLSRPANGAVAKSLLQALRAWHGERDTTRSPSSETISIVNLSVDDDALASDIIVKRLGHGGPECSPQLRDRRTFRGVRDARPGAFSTLLDHIVDSTTRTTRTSLRRALIDKKQPALLERDAELTQRFTATARAPCTGRAPQAGGAVHRDRPRAERATSTGTSMMTQELIQRTAELLQRLLITMLCRAARRCLRASRTWRTRRARRRSMRTAWRDQHPRGVPHRGRAHEALRAVLAVVRRGVKLRSGTRSRSTRSRR